MEARFSALIPTSPGDNPSSCTVDMGSHSRINRPECGLNHPSQFSAETKERVELYLHSSCSMVNFMFTLLVAFHTLKCETNVTVYGEALLNNTPRQFKFPTCKHVTMATATDPTVNNRCLFDVPSLCCPLYIYIYRFLQLLFGPKIKLFINSTQAAP